MTSASGAPRTWRWLLRITLCSAALATLVFVLVSRTHGSGGGTPLEITSPTPEAAVVFAGVGTRITDSFHLAGGTYHSVWSAWGQTPVDPPCTHSAELLAVDPANANGASGHVADLARLVHVPSTGATNEMYLANLKPGDYYLSVESACGWQIAFNLDN
ncbi:MAG TPA: hypothetical protein VGJ60_14055 [Chloroflexota bacterium]